MLAQLFDYKWQMRDENGYKLVNRAPSSSRHRTESAAALLADSGEFIERIGDNLRPYSPADFEALHLEFANVSSSQSALAFIQKYGFVTCDSSQKEESVSQILDAAKQMRYFLGHLKVHRELLETIKEKKWSIPRDHSGLAKLFNDRVTPRLTVKVDASDITRPVVRFVTQTLMGWLWICAAMDIAGKRTYKRCPICTSVYEVDLDDGRSRRRKFCDKPSCRQSAKRKRDAAKVMRPKRKK